MIQRQIRAITIIGLGGIGAAVAQALVQFLATQRTDFPVCLIDGDRYEEPNRDRVVFQSYDNKAIAKAKELTLACSHRVTLLPVPEYVTPDNVDQLIEDRDVVFACVDNHATRKIVSGRCQEIKHIALFSGGNDGVQDRSRGTFGNVQVYLREQGRDVTNPIARFHPEIAEPKDQRPDELGCTAMAKSAPQLLFTNLAVAAAILGAFYAWLQGKLTYEEAYLDIVAGKKIPVKRGVGDT